MNLISNFINKEKAKMGFAVAAIAALSMLVAQPMIVSANPHVTSIQFDSIDDVNGSHGAPFTFSCPDNPLFSPVTANGSGAIILPQGQFPDQYHVSLDWGDGSAVDVANFADAPSGNLTYTTTPDGNHGVDVDFSFTFGPHTYVTTTSFSITVKVYHSQTGGADSTDAQATAVLTCVVSHPAHLTVTKHVVNDGGGTASASDFQLHVEQNNSDVSGSPFNGDENGTELVLGAGSYVVSEDANADYDSAITGDCDANGNITVADSDVKSCTITNTFKAVYPTPYSTPYATPYETPYATPYATPYSTPYATPYETPYATPYSTPYSTPYATPYETPYSTPYATPYETPYQTPASDLSLTKTISDSTPAHNQQVTYTVKVTNGGPDTANNVEVTDNLPSNVSFISSTATQGTYDENTGIWTVGTLTDGQQETLQIVVKVTASSGTDVTNEACVSINSEVNTDNNSDNNCDTVKVSVHSTSTGGGGGYATPYATPYETPAYATPAGQVAGASTTQLPRTGNSVGYLWFLLALAVTPLIIRYQRKA